MFLNKTWFTLKLQCDIYNWITAEYEVIFYINWGWITDFQDKIVTQNITAEDSFSTNWLFEYGHNLWLPQEQYIWAASFLIQFYLIVTLNVVHDVEKTHEHDMNF